MKIFVTKSLLRNLIKSRKEDWNEDVNEDQVKCQIYNALKFDRMIDETIELHNIKWETINDRFQGVYFLEERKLVYFAPMMGVNGMPKGRNTYLSQNFRTPYLFAKEKKFDLYVSINPYDIDKQAYSTKFISMSARLMISLGAKLNNSLEIFNDEPFTIDTLIETRNDLTLQNKGNSPTYIITDNNNKTISINGRLDGANGCDSFLIASFFDKITPKTPEYHDFKIKFFDITPADSASSNSIFNQINQLNIITDDNIKTQKNIEEFLSRNEDEISSPKIQQDFLKRNQDLFRANIMKRYINEHNFSIDKCFACGYFIQNNFIASHIYRFSDIVRDYKRGDLSFDEASHLIVSGDNGFLLCPNHDKEFEKGYIIFDINLKTFVFNSSCRCLNSKQINMIKASLIPSDFSKIKFSEEFINNVSIHINRVNSNPNLTQNR